MWSLSVLFEHLLPQMFYLILSSAIILIGYPFLLVTLLPLWIYRHVVKRVLQRKDHKIGRLLEGLDGVLAGADPYSDPIAVLTPYYSLTGKLDIPQVVSVLEEKVIGPGVFPELTKKIVRRFGYHFWYSVENFNILDHVSYLNPGNPYGVVTRMDLREHLANHVSKLSFDPSRSPWEVLVVPNLVDDLDPDVKSVVVIRVHHCLMDGYSIASFTEKCALHSCKWASDLKTLSNVNPPSKWTGIWKLATFLLTGPYHVLRTLCFPFDRQEFVKNIFGPNYQESWHSQSTSSIPSSTLQNIKRMHNVSMASVITTVVAHVAIMSMKRAGKATPKRIHGCFPYPLQDSPSSTLTNHWSMARIAIEVDSNSPSNTLKFVEKQLQELKSSPSPMMFWYGVKLLSIIPAFLRYVPRLITPTTFFLINFPGPANEADIFGVNVKKVGCFGKTTKGFAFAFGCFSWNGNAMFDTGGLKCNLPAQSDADYLAECAMSILNELKVEKL